MVTKTGIKRFVQQRFILSLVALFIVACNSTELEGDLGPNGEVEIPTSDGSIEVNGTKLYYKLIGSGEPLLFLHGSGGSHRYFLPFVEEMGHDYQLVLYDRRGTGLSDGSLDMSAVTLDQFADDLDALRFELGFSAISIVAHSWGVPLALVYAANYKANVKKLILVNSVPIQNSFYLELSENVEQRVTEFSPDELETFTGVCAGSIANLSAEELAICNDLNARIRFFDPAKASAFDPTVDDNTRRNASTVQSLIRTDFNRRQNDLLEEIAALNVPTLIIHGRSDIIPLASSDFISRQIPAARLLVLEESGHFPFVEQPSRFAAEITAFLSE